MSNVTHPSHYNSGKIEVIEAIEDWGLNFNKGNALKYIARAGKKDPYKMIEDLEKAVWYLQREIELWKSAEEKRDTVRPNDMNSLKGKDVQVPRDLRERVWMVEWAQGAPSFYRSAEDLQVALDTSKSPLESVVSFIEITEARVSKR